MIYPSHLYSSIIERQESKYNNIEQTQSKLKVKSEDDKLTRYGIQVPSNLI